MATINISLPTQLKSQAELLVKNGAYVSFSDLVRDSIRQLLARNKYDSLADQVMEEVTNGQAKIFKSKSQINKYFDSL
jgi:putative addiction module CopG family antidote